MTNIWYSSFSVHSHVLIWMPAYCDHFSVLELLKEQTESCWCNKQCAITLHRVWGTMFPFYMLLAWNLILCSRLAHKHTCTHCQFKCCPGVVPYKHEWKTNMLSTLPVCYFKCHYVLPGGYSLITSKRFWPSVGSQLWDLQESTSAPSVNKYAQKKSQLIMNSKVNPFSKGICGRYHTIQKPVAAASELILIIFQI